MDIPIILQEVPLLSVSNIASFFIQWIIILFILVFSDAIIAHSIEFKKLLIISILSYLAIPLIVRFSPIHFMYDFIILPLVAWIIISEILLREATIKQKAMIASLGYIIYLILLQINLPYLIYSLLGF